MALMPVDEALARLLAGVEPCPAETLGLHEAAGRVLAAPVRALRRQPPFDASAMDGYAVRAADISTVPARLEVVGEAPAGGRHEGLLGSGQAVRIFTGAPMPAGADAVLLQEDATRLAPDLVEARETIQPGRHVRRAGLDFETGDELLPAGRVLDPAALSLAAAANHPALAVVGRPLVAILATGDELVAPGETPGPDQIVASNGYGVAAIARAAGARILDLGIVADDRAAIAVAIARAEAAGAHVIVTLGGASVGDHDLVGGVLAELGMALDFWKIAMRPGKPLMSGRLRAMRVLGLPGNPVSSMVCAHLFLVPLVAALGARTHEPDLRDAVLGGPMKANDHRQDYVRARVVSEGGQLVATPFPVQDSSMLKTLAASDGLIVRSPLASAAGAGEPCRVLMIR